MTAHPCLSYRDGRAALDFLQRAFGFEPLQVHEGPDGHIAHAEVRAGDGIVMLGDSPASRERWGDRTGQGFTYVAVPAVDELFARAQAAAAEVIMPPTDQPYGSRDFAVRDPEGNVWSFGTYAPALEPTGGAGAAGAQP